MQFSIDFLGSPAGVSRCKMVPRPVLLLLLLVSFSDAMVKMVAAPVLFTPGNGRGGDDEVQVSASWGAARTFEVGGAVCAAWWQPYDLVDSSAIVMVDVEPDGTRVKLFAKGSPNQRKANRIRIKIFAYICG